ncbi:triose-phosphate transporter family-domain-containing protein [Gymnopilus junonius]|uniref:Triose-phosphate transporter family-domain-containing protein n=1 Tax=Gymnopilus junonius TaxID=109634 RepID=A0A9P5TMQ9_GYMJU|nr:triose-phosphate transporter family-domain-containing protein [Gymnopilus junonius]
MLRRPRSVVYLERLLPGFFPRILSLPDSPLVWLALYFVMNLSLTLYNKSVLLRFPFPYTLTALHALCGTIGTSILFRLNPGYANPGARTLTSASPLNLATPNLNGKQLVVLFLFSILYTVNIVVSNASLRLVTVPFHQVVRASAPFFTIMFAALLLRKRCTKQKLLSLIPVVAGVGFATYGDYYFTPFGFFLTLLGTLLASLKTIITNVILVKPSASGLPASSDSISSEHGQNQSTFPPSFFSSLATLVINRVFPPSPSSSPTYPTKSLFNQPPIMFKLSFTLPKLCLSPLHLLYLLSPLAFIQTTLLAHFTGELDRVRWHLFGPGEITSPDMRMWLLLNGILAFGLNVVSFNANRRVGPLGMSVAANVKQVLTILCAVVVFDLTITLANGLGIVLTLIGGALYAAVELREKDETKTRII